MQLFLTIALYAIMEIIIIHLLHVLVVMLLIIILQQTLITLQRNSQLLARIVIPKLHGYHLHSIMTSNIFLYTVVSIKTNGTYALIAILTRVIMLFSVVSFAITTKMNFRMIMKMYLGIHIIVQLVMHVTQLEIIKKPYNS